MAGEYNGAAYAAVLPASQTIAVDNLLRLKQQQNQLAFQERKLQDRVLKEQADQNDALSRYAQKETDGLIKKIDEKNPFNAILTAGLYKLKNQVTDFISKGGASDAEVVNLINNGASEYMDLNARFNNLNATIEQNAAALKNMGLDPKDVAAQARRLAFYSPDPNDQSKLVLDIDKLKNIDPSYDPVADVYKNHADLLNPVVPFKKTTWTKVQPSANDVFDPQTGDLLSTSTFMNYIPGLHRPTLKDGKPYIGRVGEVSVVDTDEQGNEKPLMEPYEEINGKTGKPVTKQRPVMALSETAYEQLVDQNPQAELFANQKLAQRNKELEADGKPKLTDDRATLYKRIALYKAIPEPTQPITGSKNLTAREQLKTQETYKRQANWASLQSGLQRVRQTIADADWFRKADYTAAKTAGLADLSEARKGLAELKKYQADWSTEEQQQAAEYEQVIEQAQKELTRNHLEGTPKQETKSVFQRIREVVQPKRAEAPTTTPSANKWDKYKRN